jgi:DNA invertase Pin-like site-specific DNA recombinase
MSGKIIAYSYIRFSTREQEKGDSLRRQMDKAKDYCKKRGWRLDDTLTLRDLGVSAFRGDNAFNGNLGVFLKAIDNGSVQPGSALVVESIDRISRQGIDEGYDICKQIIKAGVLLVTLSPEREFGIEAIKSLSKGALEIQLILERAAEESERKSERAHDTWVGKRKKSVENGHILTHRLPAWVQEVGGQLELIPAKALVVKKIFDLAIAGYGTMRIVTKLTAAKVEPLSGRKHWSRSYVALILGDRRAVGDYQPRNRQGEPDGAVIKEYYPAAVTEDEWTLASSVTAKQRRQPGRVGHHVNLFAGLLMNARHGDTYFACTRTWYGRQNRLLINLGAKEGRQPSYTFPLPCFEEAVLALLRELDPHAILNGDTPPDETTAINAEKARVEARIAELENGLREGGEVAAGLRALRVLEAQARDLGDQLSDARQRAAHPLSETWGEAQGLLAALATSPDPADARTRLRDALRGLIAEAWLLVVPLPSHDRLCALQIYFHTDDPKKQKRRDYLILHRPGRNNGTPARWWSKSLSAVSIDGDLDLRRPEHAKKVEETLKKVDTATLTDQ